jgi:hypothetical protein
MPKVTFVEVCWVTNGSTTRRSRKATRSNELLIRRRSARP